MEEAIGSSHIEIARRTGAVLGFVIAVTGLAAVLGWIHGIGVLKGAWAGSPPIKLSSALGLTLAGISLWLCAADPVRGPKRAIALLCAGFLLVIASLSLLEHGFGLHLSVEDFLSEAFAIEKLGAVNAGLSPSASVALLVVATALLSVDAEFGRLWRPAQFMAILAVFLGAFCLARGFLDVDGFLFPFVIEMPPVTATAIVAIGVALLLIRPECGLMQVLWNPDLPGRIARHAIPAIVLAAVLLHLLARHGVTQNYYSRDFGILLSGMLTVALIVVIIWTGAAILHRAERILEASDRATRELATIVRSAPVAILGFDPKGRIVSSNPAAEKTYGYSAQELVGARASLLFEPGGPPEAPAAAPLWPGEGAVVGREERRRRKDGSIAEVVTARFHVAGADDDSHAIASAWIDRDISDRMRATREKEKTQERFLLAVRGATAGLWEWDPRSDVLWLSTRFREIVGEGFEVSTEGMAGHLRAIIPEDVGRVATRLRAHLENREPYDLEYRVRTGAGDVKWVQASGQAQWDDDGAAVRMVGWILDIDRRKQAERLVASARDRLKALVEHQRKMIESERTRIARELHDDMGQQITGLEMDLHWLASQPPGASGAKVREHLARAEEMVAKLAASIQRIATELRPSVLDQLGLADAIRDEARRFESRAKLRVELDLDAELREPKPEVATAIFRVFQELLTNVARHAKASRVEVRLAWDDGALRLEVWDDGIGMSPTLADAPDLSLGLLGMQERLSALGGEIAFDAGESDGTRARVTIPEDSTEA